MVKGAKMIHRLHHIIGADGLVFGGNQGLRLEKVPCVLLGKTAALDAVAVIGQLRLGEIVDAAFVLALPFRPFPNRSQCS